MLLYDKNAFITCVLESRIHFTTLFIERIHVLYRNYKKIRQNARFSAEPSATHSKMIKLKHKNALRWWTQRLLTNKSKGSNKLIKKITVGYSETQKNCIYCWFSEIYWQARPLVDPVRVTSWNFKMYIPIK